MQDCGEKMGSSLFASKERVLVAKIAMIRNTNVKESDRALKSKWVQKSACCSGRQSRYACSLEKTGSKPYTH
jgi:hypothetical protein